MSDAGREHERGAVYKVPKWTTQGGEHIWMTVPDLLGEGKQEHLVHSTLIQMSSITKL